MTYPKKPARTEYEIIEPLKERWSPRVFADKPVTESDIHQLLEAGRWAPSSNNFQPWRIIWGLNGTDVYDRIFNCLVEFNQNWAKGAPALMACAFKKTMPNGKENFHALHDLGAFSAYLTFQAQSMNIAVHQMAGIDFKAANKEFEFGDDYHVATALAIGYYGGDPTKLKGNLKDAETTEDRVRLLQKEFAFNGNFEEL